MYGRYISNIYIMRLLYLFLSVFMTCMHFIIIRVRAGAGALCIFNLFFKCGRKKRTRSVCATCAACATCATCATCDAVRSGATRCGNADRDRNVFFVYLSRAARGTFSFYVMFGKLITPDCHLTPCRILGPPVESIGQEVMEEAVENVGGQL